MMENGEEEAACNIIEQLAEESIEHQITIVSADGHHDGGTLSAVNIEVTDEEMACSIIEQLTDQNVDQITIVSSEDHFDPSGHADVNAQSLADSQQPIFTPKPPKRARNLGPRRKYRKWWEPVLEYEPGLIKSSKEGFALCTICDINVGESMTRQLKHTTSKRHINNMDAATKDGTFVPVKHQYAGPPGGLQKIATEKRVAVQRTLEIKHAFETRQAEAQLVAFIVENNLPLSIVERLVAMIKSLPSVGPSIQAIQLGKQKATNMVRQGFAPFFRDILFEQLRTTLFSLIIEEAPDNARNTNLLAVFVCFANKDLEMEVDMLQFVETNGSSQHALLILKDCLGKMKNAGVELQNWVGFQSDLSVKRHDTPSLDDMIRAEFPWVVIATCPIRVAQQAASTACEVLPQNLEEMLRAIHQFFKSYPKPPEFFLQFARLDMETLLTHGKTKWLSVHSLVKLVLEKWSDLQVHFTNAIIEDPNSGNDSVMEVLLNPIMKVFLLFLEYALDIVDEYCEAFRTDEPIYCSLKGETSQLICTMAKSFMTMESVKAQEDLMKLDVSDDVNYLMLTEVYLGYEATTALAIHMEQCQLGYNDSDVVAVLSTAQNFYKTFIQQIQSGLDFDTPIFRFVDIISPAKAYSRNPPPLEEFFNNFAHPAWSKREMEEEWKKIRLVKLPGRETLQSPLSFWTLVLNSKCLDGSNRFHHLQQLVQSFMSLPYSRDVADKILALMKEVRANSRKYLKTPTLSACLRSHCGLRRVPDAINDPELKKILRTVRSNAKAGEYDDLPILMTN